MGLCQHGCFKSWESHAGKLVLFKIKASVFQVWIAVLWIARCWENCVQSAAGWWPGESEQQQQQQQDGTQTQMGGLWSSESDNLQRLCRCERQGVDTWMSALWHVLIRCPLLLASFHQFCKRFLFFPIILVVLLEINRNLPFRELFQVTLPMGQLYSKLLFLSPAMIRACQRDLLPRLWSRVPSTNL